MSKHCRECGTLLIEKELEHEGIIPYCPNCEEYRFPLFNVACSMIVTDLKTGKIVLIQQYGRPYYILVAGYVTRGESIEDTVVREVREETGLEAVRIRFNRTKFFEPSNTLMCNFAVYVEDGSKINVNHEIDAYEWFSPDEARENVKQNSLAAEFLNKYLDDMGL